MTSRSPIRRRSSWPRGHWPSRSWRPATSPHTARRASIRRERSRQTEHDRGAFTCHEGGGKGVEIADPEWLSGLRALCGERLWQRHRRSVIFARGTA